MCVCVRVCVNVCVCVCVCVCICMTFVLYVQCIIQYTYVRTYVYRAFTLRFKFTCNIMCIRTYILSIIKLTPNGS